MRPFGTPALLLALALAPAVAGAQGTLSSQGFGYPGGQLSTRSLGAGGALGEGDALSPINPASVFNFGGAALYFQAEPEYRTVTSAGQSERSTIARYPVVAAGIPIGTSWTAGLSVSSLLDRSFVTSTRSSQVVGGQTVLSTNTFSSDGAIGDVRVALAWSPTAWIHLGAAGHVITGDNRLNNTQAFDDAAFGTLVDTQTVTYTGTAYSAGFDLSARGVATFSGSYRRGGPLSIKHADTTLRSGRVPDRLSFGAAWTGIRGTAIGARASKERWSNMAPLVVGSQRITDGWDTGVGADVLGPRVFGTALQLRAGARRRTLPFGTPSHPGPISGVVPGADVKETSFSFGAGTGLAHGRAALDLAAVRASRSAEGTAAREKAWTLSVGISVRP